PSADGRLAGSLIDCATGRHRLRIKRRRWLARKGWRLQLCHLLRLSWRLRLRLLLLWLGLRLKLCRLGLRLRLRGWGRDRPWTSLPRSIQQLFQFLLVEFRRARGGDTRLVRHHIRFRPLCNLLRIGRKFKECELAIVFAI